MKRIICIGECSLNIVLASDGTPAGSMPGGRITAAAAIMARDRYDVIMASEVSADPVGDIIAGYLSDAGVKLDSLDRFTEGHTALNIFTSPAGNSEPTSLTRYEDYPDECFDIVWPRIDEGDIVLFGGYYSIDRRMRERMTRFLSHASERKAILVYLPGFLPQQEPRITRVMPAILENLEIADVVMARDNDLSLIFGSGDATTVYRNHIDFYCRSLISVDTGVGHISYHSGSETSTLSIPSADCRTLMWNAGAAAGIVAAIAGRSLTADTFETPAQELREAILSSAVQTASRAAEALTDKWQLIQ